MSSYVHCLLPGRLVAWNEVAGVLVLVIVTLLFSCCSVLAMVRLLRLSLVMALLLTESLCHMSSLAHVLTAIGSLMSPLWTDWIHEAGVHFLPSGDRARPLLPLPASAGIPPSGQDRKGQSWGFRTSLGELIKSAPSFRTRIHICGPQGFPVPLILFELGGEKSW